ncbi:MAG: chemotaxis protein CheD [Planctomycetota bacterium]
MPANRIVRIGAEEIASGDGVLQTVLGSCVGVGLVCVRPRVVGLAHVLLPTEDLIQGTPENLHRPDAEHRHAAPARFADSGTRSLVNRMRRAVGNAPLIGTIAGGALVLLRQSALGLDDKHDSCLLGGDAVIAKSGSSSPLSERYVGAKNLRSVRATLQSLGIPIAVASASYCGGTVPRRMTIDAATGRVVVKIIGQTTTLRGRDDQPSAKKGINAFRFARGQDYV